MVSARFGFLAVCVNPHSRNLLFKPAALRRNKNKRHSYSPDPDVPSGRLILRLFDAILGGEGGEFTIILHRPERRF